ncbi:MAG: hypothetical protein ACYC91_17575 [Solirubrobacteraceae bacterium]
MSDDWRLRVDTHEDGLARAVSERLNAAELEHDLQSAFSDRVIVSVDGPEVFLYAGTREQAERAEGLVRTMAADRGWALDCELTHWHPTAEAWEAPDIPLPDGEAARQAERAERMARERAESAVQGYPEWEVRVRCRSHAETLALVEQLGAQGLRTVHRWRYLLLGAADEDSARAVADRVRALVPDGCEVAVEASAGVVRSEARASPFSLFGGLGA